MNRRSRWLAGVLVVAAVVAGLTAPGPVLARLSWVAADPIRLGLALTALALIRPLLAWPTTLLAVIAGYGYGPAGFPLALALVAATSVPPYLLARRYRTAAPSIERIARRGERLVDSVGDVRSVTASRLVPAPSDVVSAAAGASNVALAPFLVGTTLGEVPWVAAGVLVGASLDSLTAGAVGDVADTRLILAAAGTAALLLAGPAYRRLAERRLPPATVDDDST